MTGDVRERSREILREQLAEAASDYCAEHGFERVTADEIAHGIGISRATFFRYFASKEDAVVTAARLERRSLGDRLRRERPRPGTSALAAVRSALQPTEHAASAHPERLRARIRMISDSTSLRARLASDRADQRLDLATTLESFVGDRETALAVAVTAMAAIELGWNLWSADPGAELGASFDRAFALITRAGSVRIDR